MSQNERERYGSFFIHKKSSCEPPCPFHDPSDHPLNDAMIHIRTDKGFLVERICEHGVGHDDPDAVAYMRSKGHTWAGTHGCDGCCTGEKLGQDIHILLDEIFAEYSAGFSCDKIECALYSKHDDCSARAKKQIIDNIERIEREARRDEWRLRDEAEAWEGADMSRYRLERLNQLEQGDVGA